MSVAHLQRVKQHEDSCIAQLNLTLQKCLLSWSVCVCVHSQPYYEEGILLPSIPIHLSIHLLLFF